MLTFIILISFIWRVVSQHAIEDEEHDRQTDDPDNEHDRQTDDNDGPEDVIVWLDEWLAQHHGNGVDELIDQADGFDMAQPHGNEVVEQAAQADDLDEWMARHGVVDQVEQAEGNEQDVWLNDILWAAPQNNFNDDNVYPYADYDSAVDMYEGENDDWLEMARDWVDMEQEEDWEL